MYSRSADSRREEVGLLGADPPAVGTAIPADACSVERLVGIVGPVTILAGVHAVVPPHRYPQAELTAAYSDLVLGPAANQPLLARLHATAQVSSRRS